MQTLIIQVRVIEARGFQFGRPLERDDRILVTCSLDAVERTTPLASMVRQGTSDHYSPVWADSHLSTLRWDLNESAANRIRFHSPRFRVQATLLEHGNPLNTVDLGFTQHDMRNFLGQGTSNWNNTNSNSNNNNRDAHPGWCRLHGASSSGELKLSISVNSSDSSSQTDTSTALATQQQTSIGAVPDQECVRIGPDGPDASIFELSVTLVSASSLVACISRQQLAAWRRERYVFWIAYVLFDVDIITDPFSVLSRPKFPAIQDAFKLRGTVENVSTFLRDAPLVLHLHCAPRTTTLEQTRANSRHAKPVASTRIGFEHLCNKINGTHSFPFAQATSSGAHPLSNSFLQSVLKDEERRSRQRQPASGVAPQVPSVAVDLALTACTSELVTMEIDVQKQQQTKTLPQNVIRMFTSSSSVKSSSSPRSSTSTSLIVPQDSALTSLSLSLQDAPPPPPPLLVDVVLESVELNACDPPTTTEEKSDILHRKPGTKVSAKLVCSGSAQPADEFVQSPESGVLICGDYGELDEQLHQVAFTVNVTQPYQDARIVVECLQHVEQKEEEKERKPKQRFPEEEEDQEMSSTVIAQASLPLSLPQFNLLSPSARKDANGNHKQGVRVNEPVSVCVDLFSPSHPNVCVGVASVLLRWTPARVAYQLTPPSSPRNVSSVHDDDEFGLSLSFLSARAASPPPPPPQSHPPPASPNEQRHVREEEEERQQKQRIEEEEEEEEEEGGNERHDENEGRLARQAPLGHQDPSASRASLHGESPVARSMSPTPRRNSKNKSKHGSSPSGVSSGRRIGSRAWPFARTQAREFYLEVGLTSVRGLAANANVYVHFAHPLVTGLRLTRSHPPAVAHKLSEARLSNALVTCKVEISAETMEHVFEVEPLAVEVWHRDSLHGDQLIGVASLQLGDLLMEPTRFRCGARVFTTMKVAQTFVAELDTQAREAGNGASSGAGAGGSHSARRVSKRAQDRAAKAHEILAFKTLTGNSPINVLDKQQHNNAAQDDAVMRREGWLKFAIAVEDRGVAQDGHIASVSVSGWGPTKSDSPLKSNDSIDMRCNGYISDGNKPVGVSRSGAGGGGGGSAHRVLFPSQDGNETDNYAMSKEHQERIVASAVSRAVQTVRQESDRIIMQLRGELVRQKETQGRECEAAVEARVTELQREWAVREMARAEDMQTARAEYAELNQRLRRALTDVERRERAVKQLEQELRAAHEREASEMEVVARRMGEEHTHKTTLHKERMSVLEQQTKQLSAALNKSNARVKQVEDEYATFRDEVRRSPEAKLQQEVARLKGELSDMKHRVETEKAKGVEHATAKEAIKAKLFQVARELQRVRVNENKDAQRQLEKLRVEYLAREERYVLDGDRDELRSIKNELDQLRVMTITGGGTGSNGSIGGTKTLGFDYSATNNPSNTRDFGKENCLKKNMDYFEAGGGSGETRELGNVKKKTMPASELQRLMREREDLARTGMYDTHHPIMEQLGRHIEAAREMI